MEEAYAQALWVLIERGAKPHEAVVALKKQLHARGRSSLLPKIAKAFQRLADKSAKKQRFTLTVARPKDAQKAVKDVEKVLAEMKVTDAELCEVVDDSLIGGWRLEGCGVLVDNSWKKSLLSIYNRVTQ